MNHVCNHCSTPFEVTDEDLAFYDKVSPVFNGKKEQIPAPTLCPTCRHQRRLAFRNERHLYHRKCDLTGKQIISQYAQSDLKSYTNAEWWSDKWNALDYGKDMDFSRPFFEQFHELQVAVPHPAVANDSSNVNSDYANQTGYLKNCYLVYDSDYCEQTLYVQTGKHSLSCVDCLRPFHCELCYECVDCMRCYATSYSQNCENCTNGYFLQDCKGCKHCFGCSGLRNKEYCIFNEQLTKEEYEKRLSEFNPTNHSSLKAAQDIVNAWMITQPRPAHHNVSTENSTGDFLVNVQHATSCFDCNNIRDCKYCSNLSESATDCMDYDVWGYHAELLYEVMTSGYNSSHNLFCNDCWADVNDILYCDACFHSSSLFGCVGLKKNTYCILNKQYTKEEYEKLVPKIIEHMKKYGEWGEFFPIQNSLFSYNESVAHEYFPCTKEEALTQGWQWRDDEVVENQYLGPIANVPEDIRDIDETICKQILLCEVTKKPYKIIPQELKFYQDMQLPIPRKCPDQRHKERMAQRNPRTLWMRNCANCQKEMETTYAPDRPEIVYCEECFLSTIY